MRTRRPIFKRIAWSLLITAAFISANKGKAQLGADEAVEKPRVAVFPLAGDADVTLRDKVGFAIRSKLDRQGMYEAVSGVEMGEVVAGRETAVGVGSSIEDVRTLAKTVNAEVMIWGELSVVPGKPGATTLTCNIFDLLQPDPLPRRVEKTIARPTDLRFVAEAVVEALPEAGAFDHPSESAVQRDEESERLWKSGANLLTNGEFSKPTDWEGILGPERYPVKRSEWMPSPDKVVIYKSPPREGLDANYVLAMNLTRPTAESYGIACLSSPAPIEPGTRCRLSYRYKSDGPQCLVFVKGYCKVKGASGEDVEREIYRRQVPEVGPTGGEWKTVECDLNPRNPAHAVETLRVDLYAYLRPGNIQFDDVILKKVGKPTRHSTDDAIKPPATSNTTRPSR